MRGVPGNRHSYRDPLGATQITAVLIGLAKIGRLDLLTKLYENIYIPWSVYEEVVVKGGRRPSVEDIDRAKWIKKVKIKDRAAVNLLVSELGG
uniref:Uncharacterized protein n=1 Tax=Candidatus Methanogaster sp. ANME-2c ERB4 TaxID=2759911 RepID=A0A7G9Y341_9EURY|nr:hypothetical protein ODADPOMJ_00018 [Methanosarcinales archaeon ANME-2c ERB4]